jgi:choline dehydrogenase
LKHTLFQLSLPDINTVGAGTFFSSYCSLRAIGFNAVAAANPNVFSLVNLRAGSSSRGYVRLTGSHPQDLLNINKLRFQSPDGQQDIVALRERFKQWREIMKAPKLGPLIEREILPGANVTSDEDLENYILENIYCEYSDPQVL